MIPNVSSKPLYFWTLVLVVMCALIFAISTLSSSSTPSNSSNDLHHGIQSKHSSSGLHDEIYTSKDRYSDLDKFAERYVGDDDTSTIQAAPNDDDGFRNELILQDVENNQEKSFEDVNSSLHNGDIYFFEKYCDLQGDEWWPSDWRIRTPFFLLIGTKKGGTSSLHSWLGQHPLIVQPRVKELLYFLPKQKPKFDNITQKFLVRDIRSDIYSEDYEDETLQFDDTFITFESTPGYLFFSTLSRVPILCTMPWVKLLITLRNPVDRVFSNYNFLLDFAMRHDIKSENFPTLDQMIQRDVQLLKETGVLPKTPSPSFYGSIQERVAWTTYQTEIQKQRIPYNEGVVGRGLYILQLQEWYSGLRELGRDPESEILIVRNDEMKYRPDDVYQKILWWLELPAFTPDYTSKLVTTYRSEAMSEESKHLLDDLFRPYNQRLFHLLGWDDNVWDINYEKELEEAESEENAEEEEEEAIEENMNEKELEHIYDLPNYDEVKAKNFTDKWCILDKVSWFPPPNKIWQLRAPYFILPGAKKSGTTSLAKYLMQHPLVENARTKELQFFLNKNFLDGYITPEGKTRVREARSHLYQIDYHSEQLRHNKSLISFDGTPGYMFKSDFIPQRILCVAPWIKIVIILRNPVDRAYSNWAFAMWRNHVKNVIPFETYIEYDIELLQKHGFFQAQNPQEEEKAWHGYMQEQTEGPIGRSLYEIQLRQWFQALRDIGRDPKTLVHILRTEHLKQDLQGEMKKIHKFLGLPYEPVVEETEYVVTTYTAPMKNETRERLEKLYDPYNQRFYQLLQENGFGKEWYGSWDQH